MSSRSFKQLKSEHTSQPQGIISILANSLIMLDLELSLAHILSLPNLDSPFLYLFFFWLLFPQLKHRTWHYSKPLTPFNTTETTFEILIPTPITKVGLQNIQMLIVITNLDFLQNVKKFNPNSFNSCQWRLTKLLITMFKSMRIYIYIYNLNSTTEKMGMAQLSNYDKTQFEFLFFFLIIQLWEMGDWNLG